MNESVEEGHPESGQKFLILCLGAVVGLIALVYAGGLIFGYSPSWYQGYGPIQPVPFSHRLHAGQYKMPCLYCHGSAEYAAHAEVPGLETCMNCHTVVKTDSPWIKQLKASFDSNKPVKWAKVHILPDFVKFNHKKHIVAGVDCATCHGPIHEMDKVYQWAPLTMGWCVNCHRNDNYVQPHRVALSQEARAMKGLGEKSLVDKILTHKDPHNADVSCSTCHY